MKILTSAILVASLVVPTLASGVFADEDWRHHDIHQFREHDLARWRAGAWHHGFHDGRSGWWWVVGGVWYFYPAPVYPYPDPYGPPGVVGVGPSWYYCANPQGYYPYVPQCLVPWQAVPSEPAPPPVAVTPPPPAPPPPSSGGANTTLGTIGGAVAGGLAGSQFGKGSGKLAATALGTLLGAFVGHQIGASLDQADQQAAQRAAQWAYQAPVGQQITWNNPDNGHSGTVTPTREGRDANGNFCRQFDQTVTIGGQSEQVTGTACRMPDGTWKVVNQ